MTGEAFDVKVRREPDACHNPSAPRIGRQYANIRDDAETVAILLGGGEVSVTAIWVKGRKRHDKPDLSSYPGDPVHGLAATISIRTLEPEDEDYWQDSVNRVVSVAWGTSGMYAFERLADEAAVMGRVLAEAARLAALTETCLRVTWFQGHLAEREAM